MPTAYEETISFDFSESLYRIITNNYYLFALLPAGIFGSYALRIKRCFRDIIKP